MIDERVPLQLEKESLYFFICRLFFIGYIFEPPFSFVQLWSLNISKHIGNKMLVPCLNKISEHILCMLKQAKINVSLFSVHFKGVVEVNDLINMLLI